jgi:hypothetical protein
MSLLCKLSNSGLLILAAPILAIAECTMNGQVVPCGQVPPPSTDLLVGVAAMIFVGFVISLLWLVMMGHCLVTPVPKKWSWFIIMLLTGFVGSLVYYFKVYKKVNKAA